MHNVLRIILITSATVNVCHRVNLTRDRALLIGPLIIQTYFISFADWVWVGVYYASCKLHDFKTKIITINNFHHKNKTIIDLSSMNITCTMRK